MVDDRCTRGVKWRRAVWLPILAAAAAAAVTAPAADATPAQAKRITALTKQVRQQQARIRTLTAERDRNLGALDRAGLFDLVWSVRYMLNDGGAYTTSLYDSDLLRFVSFSWSKPL